MNIFEAAVCDNDAYILERTRHYNARLKSLLNYLEQDSKNELLMLEAFQCCLGAAQWVHASDLLEKARLSSADIHGWKLREGELMLAQGDMHKAKSHFLAMTSVPDLDDSVSAVSKYNLAFVYFELGELEASHDALVTLLISQSTYNSESIWTSLQCLYLRVLHRLGNLEQAMAWVGGIDNTFSLTPDAYGIASLIAIDAGDFDKARLWLNRASAQDLPSLEKLISQSSLALADQDGAAAKHSAGLAIKINPKDGRSWSSLAFAFLLEGELQLAQQTFAVAVELMPTHIGTLHGSGWVDILMGQWPAARFKFDKAIELDRNFADSHGGFAVVLAKTNLPAAAAASAKLALKLDPSCVSAHYAIALLEGNEATAQMVEQIKSRLGLSPR